MAQPTLPSVKLKRHIMLAGPRASVPTRSKSFGNNSPILIPPRPSKTHAKLSLKKLSRLRTALYAVVSDTQVSTRSSSTAVRNAIRNVLIKRGCISIWPRRVKRRDPCVHRQRIVRWELSCCCSAHHQSVRNGGVLTSRPSISTSRSFGTYIRNAFDNKRF